MFHIKITLILSLSYVCWCQSPPESIGWNTWAEQLIATHLINMTAELIKDAKYKLVHAGKIQEKYMHTITYELGTIAAGIQDTYKHMLEIYRTYSNMTDFIKKKYDIHEFLNAYHVVQGDYHQIRLEQNVFYEILDKHEEKRREIERLQNRYRNKHKRKPPKVDARRSLGAEVKWKNGEAARSLWNQKVKEWDFMKMNNMY